jgi:DNA-binding IclR family transcriptional regulator
VHRLLQAFEERSLVRRDAGGRLLRGLELVRLGRLAARFSVQTAVRPILEKLAAELDETSMLGLLDPQRGELMVVDYVQTSQPLRYMVEVDTWRPLWAGRGAGRARVPGPGAARRRAQSTRRGRSRRAHPRRPRRSRSSARGAGEGVRGELGQRTEGAVALAAPVRDADDRVVGTVCLTLPDNRFHVADESRPRVGAPTAARPRRPPCSGRRVPARDLVGRPRLPSRR